MTVEREQCERERTKDFGKGRLEIRAKDEGKEEVGAGRWLSLDGDKVNWND